MEKFIYKKLFNLFTQITDGKHLKVHEKKKEDGKK